VFLTLGTSDSLKGWTCLFSQRFFFKGKPIGGIIGAETLADAHDPICSALQLVRYKLNPPPQILPSTTDGPFGGIESLHIQTRDMLFDLEMRDVVGGVEIVANEHCAGETATAWGELNQWQVREMRDWLNRWLEKSAKEDEGA
jgi:hypothetical protein